ncbi:unnamed protein product [Leptidea sinapis]|uniref:Odorant receptor n=1 Tax=Leptidea sinapis TaxID=189913 RepID=A0A5E4QXE8_9NEOP|nr:unnamed protein product [Leptidea sinapis]
MLFKKLSLNFYSSEADDGILVLTGSKSDFMLLVHCSSTSIYFVVEMNNFNDAIDFEDLFKVMVIAMRLSWSHPDVPRNLKWLFRFLLYHSIMTIIACLSAYSIIFHDIKYDISRACTNGIAVLIYFVVSFKYGLLVWHQHKFKTIIEQIKHDYKVAVSLPHKEYNVVLLYAQKGREVTHFWLKCSAAAILLFPVKSFALMSYYYIKGDFRYVAPLELALPNIFDPENNEVECFIAILILFSLTEIYVFCVYLSFSPLGPIAILHACGQLEIARMRSLNIFSQCDNRDDAKKIIKSQGVFYSRWRCIRLFRRAKKAISVLM